MLKTIRYFFQQNTLRKEIALVIILKLLALMLLWGVFVFVVKDSGGFALN